MHLINRNSCLDGSNLLCRIDPRIKIISVLAMLVMVTSGRGFLFPLAVALLSLVSCLVLGVRPKALLTRFAEPAFIALMVVILKLLFSGSEQLFSVGIFGLEVTGQRDGLMEGVMIAARICGAVSLVALLGFSTPFTDLMAALAWMRVPRGFIEVALFAWRYLFVLFDDAQVLYAAQKNRLGYVGFVRGLRSFGTLSGALVIKAFDNSQTITTAMTQRGYDGTMPLLMHAPFKWREVALSLSVLAVMGVAWSI